MSNVMRWRYGDTNPVVCAVDSATVIEIGDLVYLDTDDVKPASQQADSGQLLYGQDVFADKFIGVAMEQSRSGDTDSIRVATTGVFEFACTSQTWEIADLVGAGASGTALADQTVAKLAANREYAAIGTCAKRSTSNTTTVFVNIKSSKMHGGVQPLTAST